MLARACRRCKANIKWTQCVLKWISLKWILQLFLVEGIECMDLAWKRALGLSVGMLWLTSCSVLIDVDGKQCRVSTDCSDKGLGAQCVEGVCSAPAAADDGAASVSPTTCATHSDCVDPTPVCLAGSCKAIADAFYCAPETAIARSTVTYSFNVRDFQDRELVPPMIEVKACQHSDVECTNPVSTYKDDDGTGEVVLMAPKGVPVFFAITAQDRLPVYLYDSGSSSMPNVDRNFGQIPAPTLEYALLVHELTGVDYVPLEDGLVFSQVFDCTGTPAAGVSFKKDRDVQGAPFAFINHIGNFSEMVTQYDSVYNQAWGGFAGLPGGILGINAYWHDTMLANGTTSITVIVRGGAITYVNIRLYNQ